MKTRNGFVSNLSSSSFIVSFKGDKTKVLINIEIDLANYGKIISSKKELLNYYKNIYEYKSEKRILSYERKYGWNHYKLMLDEIEKGNKIIIGSFSDSSEDNIERYLGSRGLTYINSVCMKVIHNDKSF